jgi:ankyrin repeat protein
MFGKKKIFGENNMSSTKRAVGKPKAAVEIMVLNPDPAVNHNNKSVHENLWIKERYGKDNYLSIGVLLKKDTSELQFYFYEDCDKYPNLQLFSSLSELQKYLPSDKKDIFDRTHKVYLMGHGDNESKYGFGNYHAHDDFGHPPDDTEQIYDNNFDKLIKDILRVVPTWHDDFGITLEVCHADNLVTAANKGETKSFLERLSLSYPDVTFGGTGPWSDSEDSQETLATGARASGGYPILNAPITSMVGGIWKHGNTVIFHNDGDQIAVRKSPFASTETAKNLKINTVNYAREVLNQNPQLSNIEREKIIAKICVNRKILKIEDLKHEPNFRHEIKYNNEAITKLSEDQKIILKQEQDRYLSRVDRILGQDKYSDRDLLLIALGLNHRFIFDSNDHILQKVLNNEKLLKLVMVSCGKVLLSGQDNNNVIDLLVNRGISIDSVDERGMTALHYASNNFYIYRAEQFNLVNKLLDCGANVEAQDKAGRTPLMLASEQSKKVTVMGGGRLLELLQQRQADKKQVIDTNAAESKSNDMQPPRRGELYPGGKQANMTKVEHDMSKKQNLSHDENVAAKYSSPTPFSHRLTKR